MEALAMPQSGGTCLSRSYVIVPADSPARHLADLRGKTFAFSDPLSNAGRLAPTYALFRMGHVPERFFRKTIFTYSHDKSIEAVAQKWVDGAAVHSLVFDYLTQRHAEVTRKTRVIYRSPLYGNPPVVVNPGLDPELKRRLRALLLHMHEDAEGRRILGLLSIERLVPLDDRSYDPVRRMDAQMRRMP